MALLRLVHQVRSSVDVFTVCGKCQSITQHVDMALLRRVHQVGCLCRLYVCSVTQHVDMVLLRLVRQVGCVCVHFVYALSPCTSLKLFHQVSCVCVTLFHPVH